MDRNELSGAIIAEMDAVVHAAREPAVPALLEGDLAALEQRAQQLGRMLLGRLIDVTVARQARALPRPARCAPCGGPLRERTRPRHRQGLVGDDRLERIS